MNKSLSRDRVGQFPSQVIEIKRARPTNGRPGWTCSGSLKAVWRARASTTRLSFGRAHFDQPARVAANVGNDMMFGIEPGAARDGGETVTFIACPFESNMAGAERRASSIGYYQGRQRQPHDAENPRCGVGAAIHPGDLSAVPQPRPDRACRWASRVRAAQRHVVGPSMTGTMVVKDLQHKRFPRLTKNYDYNQFSLLP